MVFFDAAHCRKRKELTEKKKQGNIIIMIITIICFRDSKKTEKTNVSEIADILTKRGFYTEEICILNYESEKAFAEKFNNINTDNVIIADSFFTEFSVKDIICGALSAKLCKNEEAMLIIKTFLLSKNLKPTYKTEELASFPEGSTLIPNKDGLMQGFKATNNGQNVYVISDTESVSMLEDFVVPDLEEFYNKRQSSVVLKLFNIKRAEIEAVIKEQLKSAKKAVNFDMSFTNLDVRLEVVYNSKTPKMIIDEILRVLYSELKDNIYAQDDRRLSEVVFDYLKVKKKKVSVAESFTGGRIASELIKNAGISEFFTEGIVCYSNESKMKRLNVQPQTLSKHGAVSSEVAYEMALSLLAAKGCDISIATTGYAGGADNAGETNIGLCFIAVGVANGIHVFKFNFDGTREEITEQATQAALFKAIYILKSI